MIARVASAVRAVIVVAGLLTVHEAWAQQRATTDRTVAVVVSGNVPGFATPQLLAAFLARRMQAGEPSWHFVAAAADAPLAGDRVEWKFATLKVVWPGGSHNGFPGHTVERAYISAEARLYLADAYQTTTLSQPTVSGEQADHALGDMALKVAQAMAALVSGGK